MALPEPGTASPVAPARLPAGELAGLALLALVVRLPAFLSAAHLGFDDGVYGSSALAMRDGEVPFRDVFSPQGPLHLPLVFLADLAGFRTANAPRLLALAAGVVTTLGVYAAGRRLGSRGSALLAAALTATTGSLLWTTGPLTGDGPAVAFATLAVAAALAWRDRPTTGRAALAGALVGAALATKAIVAPVLLPIGVVLLAGRRARPVVVAGGAAAAVALAAALPFGLDRVWDQSVAYHRGADRLESVGAQAAKLVTTLLSRDLALVVATVLGLAAAALAPAARRPDPRVLGVLSAWFVAGAALLVFEPTMFRNHIASLVPPLALLVAVAPPPARWFAIAAIGLVPWWIVQLHDVVWPRGYAPPEAAVVADLRSLPAGAWAITDEPGLAWRAGRRMPGWLNDSSIKRIEQGMITTASLAREAARPQVCAVAIWSYRYGGELPGLPAALAAEGYAPVSTYGRWRGPGGTRGERTLWRREACAPPD